MSAERPDLDCLTARQREVLELVAQGFSEKEIAQRLSISPSRVTQHVRAIKDRLGVESRSGLVAAAAKSPCQKITGEKIIVPQTGKFGDLPAGAIPEYVTLSDIAPAKFPLEFESATFRVGPGAFDGPGATLLRAAAIIAISLGIPALLVLLVTARWAVTAAALPTP